jgi:hypothetical protein
VCNLYQLDLCVCTGHRKIEVNEWDVNSDKACALPSLEHITFELGSEPLPWRGEKHYVKNAKQLKEVVQKAARCWAMHLRHPVMHNIIALCIATVVASMPTLMRVTHVSAFSPLAEGCRHQEVKASMIFVAAGCIWLMAVRLMQYLFDALYVSAVVCRPLCMSL